MAVWTVAASAGVVALLSASEPVFRAAQARRRRVPRLPRRAVAVVSALSDARDRATRSSASARRSRRRRAFRQGLLSNLGNPKIAVFFASLLPQFVPEGARRSSRLLALGSCSARCSRALLAFVAVSVVVICTPGQDTALTIATRSRADDEAASRPRQGRARSGCLDGRGERRSRGAAHRVGAGVPRRQARRRRLPRLSRRAVALGGDLATRA